jgi:hypothetical protein
VKTGQRVERFALGGILARKGKKIVPMDVVGMRRGSIKKVRIRCRERDGEAIAREYKHMGQYI